MAPKTQDSKLKLSGTDLIHADDGLHGPEVAPSVSVSTSQFVEKSCVHMWNAQRILTVIQRR